MIRVLVVEDSAVTREYLVYLLEQEPGLKVVGTARDGVEALEQAEQLRPDIITMDVHMPRMNGYEATRRIMEQFPTRIVMVSASTSREEMDTAFEALKVGALTLVDKPGGPDHPNRAKTVRTLIETVTLMSEVKVVRRWRTRERPAPPPPLPARPSRAIRLIAIGASTGGPQVLAGLLGKLPGDLAAPLLIVQHIAAGFTQGLVEWLSRATRLQVKVAEPDEKVRSGTAYFAPVDCQMGIAADGRIRLAKEPAVDGFCPSASYLFQSVAQSYGGAAIGVLLTGMGRDGAGGLLRLHEAGGVTMAQDEDTSVVFGMPAEAIRLGAARHVLPPDRIAEMIRAMVPSA